MWQKGGKQKKGENSLSQFYLHKNSYSFEDAPNQSHFHPCQIRSNSYAWPFLLILINQLWGWKCPFVIYCYISQMPQWKDKRSYPHQLSVLTSYFLIGEKAKMVQLSLFEGILFMKRISCTNIRNSYQVPIP